MSLWSVLSLAIFLLVLGLVTGQGANGGNVSGTTTCSGLLPPQVVADRTKSWKVVEVSDLSEEDQQLWTAAKRGKCPGVAKADFDGSGRIQFAVLMKSTSKLSNLRLIHAAKNKAGSYETKTLFEGPSANTPIIYAGNPGKYAAIESRETPITIATSTIILEMLESGSTAYYFKGKQVLKIMISE